MALYFFRYCDNGLNKKIVIAEHLPQDSTILWIKQMKRFSVKETLLIALFDHLHHLINIPLPIADAVRILSHDYPDTKSRLFLGYVHQELLRGKSFSYALRDAPSFVRSRLFIGEQTGDMLSAFQDSLFYLKQKQEFCTEIFSALRYPLFLFLMICCVCVVLSLSLTKVYFLIYTPFFAIGLSFFIWEKIYKRFKIEHQRIQILWTLGCFLKEHIPLMKAIDLTSQCNPFVDMENLSKSLQGGHSLQESFSKTSLNSLMILDMLRIGEETGKLGPVCLQTAYVLKEQWIQNGKRIISYIEPALIVVLGAIIMGIVITVILPMYDDIAIS